MLENKRIQKPREFWISTAYFRASTVFNNLFYIYPYLDEDEALKSM